MAFVLLQHLDPKHPSVLPELLAAKTAMAVAEAAEGVEVTADHVYVAPAAADLLIEGPPEAHGARAGRPAPSADRPLLSIAGRRCGERAIGVVLSGAA